MSNMIRQIMALFDEYQSKQNAKQVRDQRRRQISRSSSNDTTMSFPVCASAS